MRIDSLVDFEHWPQKTGNRIFFYRNRYRTRPSLILQFFISLSISLLISIKKRKNTETVSKQSISNFNMIRHKRPMGVALPLVTCHRLVVICSSTLEPTGVYCTLASPVAYVTKRKSALPDAQRDQEMDQLDSPWPTYWGLANYTMDLFGTVWPLRMRAVLPIWLGLACERLFYGGNFFYHVTKPMMRQRSPPMGHTRPYFCFS